MVQLASKDEGDLVKLAVPIIAMLDDYEFTSRESMTNDAAERVVMMQKIWETIGGREFEAKRSARDPILFPGNTLENNLIMSQIGGLKSISINPSERFTGKADASLLAKMPPTIIWESEFDQYLTPTTRCTAVFQLVLEQKLPHAN